MPNGELMQMDSSQPASPKKSTRKRGKKAKSQNPGSGPNINNRNSLGQKNKNQKTAKGRNSSMKESKYPSDKNQLQCMKYKTSLCRHWEQYKTCALGNACSFAHGDFEKRNVKDPLPQTFPGKEYIGAVHSNYKTQICKNFETNGSCKYGNMCCFAHGEHQMRSLTDPMPMIPQEVLLYSPPKMRMPQAIGEGQVNHQQLQQQPEFFSQ